MSAHNLANQIDNIKQKLTDKEYKSLMEETAKLNDTTVVKCKLTILQSEPALRYKYIKSDNLSYKVGTYQHQLFEETNFKISDEIVYMDRKKYDEICDELRDKSKRYYIYDEMCVNSFINICNENVSEESEDESTDIEVCVNTSIQKLCIAIDIMSI
jgi:hypothetical protein